MCNICAMVHAAGMPAMPELPPYVWEGMCCEGIDLLPVVCPDDLNDVIKPISDDKH